MQEAAWIASSQPSRMLNTLRVRRPSEARKFRLFAVACCRRIWDLLDEPGRRAIDGLEGFASGRIDAEVMAGLASEALAASWARGASTDRADGGPWIIHAANAASDAVAWEDEHQRRRQGPVINLIARASGTAYHAAHARSASLHPSELGLAWQQDIQAEEAAQADLVREIFGNVFRPTGFDPDWRSPRAVDLARSIESSGDFEGMPAIGDALEEAGCDRDEILAHCRGPARHVRGCWALDLVIGRPQV